MIYVIIGRTCSGKDTFASELEKQGLKRAMTWTTRPQRGPEDNKYMFISKEKAASIPEENKFLKTVLDNGYEYFCDPSTLDQADFIILEPDGLKELCKGLPDLCVNPIYIMASDEARTERGKTRPGGPDAFDARNRAEAARFTDFEAHLSDDRPGYISDGARNCCSPYVLYNSDAQGLMDLKASAVEFRNLMQAHDRVIKIIERAIRMHIVNLFPDGHIQVWLNTPENPEPHPEPVSKDVFAGYTLSSNDGLSTLITSWLARDTDPGSVFKN